jgi:glutaredoxin
MGLPEKAEKFLADNVRMIETKCPYCGHAEVTDTEDKRIYASAKNEGMFDDGPELYEYTLNGGEKVREVVQAAPWSSGPCIFLKLVDEAGKDLFTWADKDINNA